MGSRILFSSLRGKSSAFCERFVLTGVFSTRVVIQK